MKLRNDRPYRPGCLGHVLSRRDWAYALALLVPFVAYDLALKIVRIVSLSDEHGLLGSLQLVRSDLLFNIGYVVLWVGLFAVARAGLWRVLVVGLFHGVTILLALIATAAHRFYEVTGSTLDFDVVLFFLSSPGEVWAVAASEVTPLLVVAVSAALLYAVLGPWLLARLVARPGASTGRGAARLGITQRGFAALCAAAVALFSLSLLPGGVAAHESESTAHASESFSREAFVNAAVTGIEEITEDQGPPVDAEVVREQLPLDTSLARTAHTEERNVVVVHLESVRAGSVTPYDEDLDITPFLEELSEESLLAERAYAVVPHTTNALVATLCGIDPPVGRWQTYLVGDWIPTRCLPDLLGERGYNSVYFTSSEQTFERRPEVVENMGYEEFYPVETMDKEGFEKANYFGYEDNIMLEPSREWLEENAEDGPFFATYETITPHHDYLAPDDRYGRKEFAEEDALNRYLNSVHYVDFFVMNLIQQYKDLGLYDNTIFVVYGDHGEAFGEHDLKQHDNVPYEEGLRIPLLVHHPQRFQSGEHVRTPVNHLDILPTVLDLLGYRVEGGDYPGSSLLGPPPEDRTLMASCWYDEECLASIEGDEKYIYHYGDRPEELYDLTEDPLERNNLADERDADELRQRRHDLLEWRARVDAMYTPPPSNPSRPLP
jgi:lipoteichoic acid synthase